MELAQTIAEQAPVAIRQTMISARLAMTDGISAAISKFEKIQSELAATEDGKEGLESFTERRGLVL